MLEPRRGWVRIAVIAIGFAVLLVMADGDRDADGPGFLVEHHLLAPSSTAHRGPGGAASTMGPWMAMLPALFVGVMAQLGLLSPRSVLSLGRAGAAPALPCRFQRPPPASLF